jgi:hypothetical protein
VKVGKFVLVLLDNGSKYIMLVGKFKEVVFDVLNLFAIKKTEKSAKNATDSGCGDKDLAPVADGNGAGGVDGVVVGNLIIEEICGGGGRGGGGGGRSDRNEVGRGKVGEGMVEEVGNVGVAGGEVGVGNGDVGVTVFSLFGNGSTIDFASENVASAVNSLPGISRGNKRKARNIVCFEGFKFFGTFRSFV